MIQNVSTTADYGPQAAECLLLAERFMREGRRVEAGAVLTRAVETYPNLDAAYHALGLLAFEAGELARAADLVGQAVLLCPDNALYLRNRGELCRRLGQLDAAVESARRASELAPQDVDAHFNLGLALADRGDWPEAIAAYHRALALRPDHGLTWNNLGVALERSGQGNEALRAYLQATHLNPQHVEAQLNLAVLYRRAGRLNDASACFQRAQQLAPGFSETMGVATDTRVAEIHPPEVTMRDTGSVRGRGVFALRAFLAGDLVETSPVILLHADYQALPAEIKSYVFNWGKLCGLGSAHALALGYGSLFNHDNPASLRYEADPANLSLRFLATRDIAAGEELTINYDAPQGNHAGGSNDWFARMHVKPIVSEPQGG